MHNVTPQGNDSDGICVGTIRVTASRGHVAVMKADGVAMVTANELQLYNIMNDSLH